MKEVLGYNLPMDGKLGYGLIGPGSIAATHAEALSHSSKAYLAAVYGRDEERAKAFALRYGAKAYSDLGSFLDDPDVKAVVVTTPAGSHLRFALAAIGKGKPVLSEKPLDTTPERCGMIIRAGREKGVKIGCMYQSRFYPGPRLVHEAIEEGRFGRIVLIEASVKWSRPQEYYTLVPWRCTLEDGGGVLMNQASHAVDLLSWFGGPVSSVEGYTGLLSHAGLEAEDNAVAVLRFSSGALGVINASTSIHPGYPRRLEIMGTEGSAVLEDNCLTAWDFRTEKPEDARIRASFAGSGASGSASTNLVSDYSGHLAGLEDFADAVVSGREPAVTGEEALKSVSIIHRIYAQNGLVLDER